MADPLSARSDEVPSLRARRPGDVIDVHAEDRAEIRRLRDLVDRAVYPVTAALNCSAHPWHGSDEARRWLMEASDD